MPIRIWLVQRANGQMDHCGRVAVHPIHRHGADPLAELSDHWRIAVPGSSDRAGLISGGD